MQKVLAQNNCKDFEKKRTQIEEITINAIKTINTTGKNTKIVK